MTTDLERCRLILHRSTLNEPLADHEFLLSVLALHPEAEAKIGCGVDHFEVRVNARFHNRRSLWLVRTDGTETDWSFIKCFKAPSHRAPVLAAMRVAVSDQIIAFRDIELARGACCAVTGVPLTTDCHVDHHEPSFEELADHYVTVNGLWQRDSAYASVALLPTADGMIGRRLADQKFIAGWVQFHAQHARLRLTTAHANLSKRRKA